jgi:hypothetical protein
MLLSFRSENILVQRPDSRSRSQAAGCENHDRFLS